MSDNTLIERIEKLPASQVSRSVELLMPRLADAYQKHIPEMAIQLVEAPDLTQASRMLAETFEAQEYPVKEGVIQRAVEREENRVELARKMLIILAGLPETRQLVDMVITSVDEEMFVAETLAVGVAASMILLSSSVVIAICRMKPEVLPEAVKNICDAIKGMAPEFKIGG